MTTPQAREVDVIVLGGGPVGENVAQYATEDSGLTAAIVEAELVGGECSYWACMPSKALLRPLSVRTLAEHLRGLETPALDTTALLANRDAWVSHYDDKGQVDWAESIGVEVFRGHGRLTGERTVAVGATQLTARHAVVIATGSEPVVPRIYADALPWGSRDVTGVVEIPERLAIVGGGVVACEAATWMAGLGSRVTLVVRGDRLLKNQEAYAGQAVLEGLRAIGVDVQLEADVRGCRRTLAEATGIGRRHGGPVILEFAAGSREFDELVVAAGRRPRLGDLGLEAVGLTSEQVLKGALPAWLHAVGDASGEAPLTHWGKYRARVLGDRIAAAALGRESLPEVADAPVPQVVFTDPQVATVGLTEAAARAAGHEVVTAQVPFTAAAGGALTRDDAPGAAKLVVDARSGRVLGATFVGPEAGELLHAATIAITGRLPVWVLRHAVPAYPTASELWLRLLEDLPRDLRRRG